MREVRIKDTLSGEVRALEPRESGRAGIYACGPTVYGRIHVGNARPYVVFMLVGRLLRHLGYETTVVMNVTDVNDKIYDAAKELGVPSAEHAAEMTRLYTEDTGLLGIGRPDSEPLATETIPEIVEMIEALIEREHAYESGGDVYFRVRSFDGYGKLSNRDPDEMDQGEEAGTQSLKENPLDFALWKAQKPGEDTAWKSPWGDGRPGWHIECSAMAEKVLGADFEIHGGGVDLVFPHHENEVAQSEGARGRPLARIWMHNGMIRIAEEKMSKSVGNIFGLREAIDAYGAHAVVAFLISGHYRQPLEFSDGALEEASARVDRIRNFLREPGVEGEDDFAAEREEALVQALCDDFNTPRALAAVFELIAEANRREVPGARAALERMLPLLGLEGILASDEEAGEEAQALLRERDEARAARDFERADNARDRLAELGWEVRDSAEGSKLVRRG
ncbi:MAG: cysteinyl-tRNA synthetase [Solirubrobacterales bacterium]|jgi:cysteinyl-tRNA synthetase|nr:cysteinyl-tRNA synthetase [Solirubrobacterales bacterium]